MLRNHISIFSFVLLCALIPITAEAQTDLVTYQGKLNNAAGAELPTGIYKLGFRIWDTSTAGTIPLWSRKYDVPVTAGQFSVMIGAPGSPWVSAPALTESLKLALSGVSRFVEITVMSDAGGLEKPEAQWQILGPRQQLGSVPYAMNGVPVGTVLPFAGTEVPGGWLLCNGDFFPSTDSRYAALYAVVLSQYGNNGSDTFRVPDLRSRVPMGVGQGIGLSNRTIGQILGAETHELSIAQMPAHNHGNTGSAGDHQHTSVGAEITTEGSPFGKSSASYSRVPDNRDGIDDGKMYRTSKEGAHTHTIPSQGSGQAHNIIQPSLGLNYIIKL